LDDLLNYGLRDRLIAETPDRKYGADCVEYVHSVPLSCAKGVVRVMLLRLPGIA
jgi:hypothetical protein